MSLSRCGTVFGTGMGRVLGCTAALMDAFFVSAGVVCVTACWVEAVVWSSGTCHHGAQVGFTPAAALTS